MTLQDLLKQANNLRQNGQFQLGDSIYNHLLSVDPNNGEFIFCKAMNVIESDPILAILLFKKSVMANPSLTVAFGNISATAIQSGNYSEAINAFNELHNCFPNNLDIIYYRAIQICNSGNILHGLLEFYSVVERSALKNDGKAFLAHEIADSIIYAKTQLRHQTTSNPNYIEENSTVLENVVMSEYHYPLPIKFFGTEKYLFDFGSMLGMTTKEVIDTKPDYIVWCVLNIDSFCVSEEIIEIIKRKGVTMGKSESLNLIKLNILEEQRFNASEEIEIEFLDDDEDIDKIN